MKNQLQFLLTALFLTVSFSFGIAQKKPKSELKEKVKLTFQRSEGTNGTAVAWNPDEKMYYAVIAGNANFPLEAFTKKGKPVADNEAGFDFRGLWFNEEKGRLEGNGLGNFGYCNVLLDNEGKPTGSVTKTVSGQNQPEEQSAGTYDPISGHIVFYSDGIISHRDATTGDEVKTLSTKLPVDEMNFTSIGCTGREGYEYVLLNVEESKLTFVNTKGEIAATRELPEGAIVSGAFRFAYANKMAFLYDVEFRTWTGYKVY